MSNVISLKAYRAAKTNTDERIKNILNMDHLQLLDEMVRWQNERSKVGLNLEMISTGLVLFKQLQKTAFLEELRILCGSYIRSLKIEELRYKG